MMKWFGVKTIYMTTATGKATLPYVRTFEPSSVRIEERVVLFKARNIESAIKKGEREAEKYANTESKHISPYLQTVRTRYVGCCDAYMLDDKLGNGQKKVYSATEVRLTKPTKAELESTKLGLEYGKREKSLRSKFWRIWKVEDKA
ncbi:MAG: DUF4288 domain-containing protein [Nitrospinota bacterium]